MENQPPNNEQKSFSEDYVKELRNESASYRHKAKDAESKLAEVMSKLEAMNNTRLQREVEYHSKALNVVDPQAVSKLLDMSKFNPDNDFEGLNEAIKTLVEEKPYLRAEIGKPSNPATGNGLPSALTKEQVKKMSPEEINANWESIQDSLSKGLL